MIIPAVDGVDPAECATREWPMNHTAGSGGVRIGLMGRGANDGRRLEWEEDR